MKRKIPWSLTALVLSGILFTACTKIEPRKTFDPDAGNSYVTTDNLFKDLNNTINAAAADNNLTGKKESAEGANALCAAVTLNPNDWVTFPKTVTVDFGSGCTDQYGVTRKGVLTAVFTDYLHNPGAYVVVTPSSNYYVNGVKVDGTYTLRNTSANNTTRTFADTIRNGKATTPDGKTCTWEAVRSSEQTGGFGTPLITDDEYTGQATSSGTGFSGSTWEATAQNILWKLNCRYLVSGTVTIHSNGDPTPVIVDLGNGACDNKYSASYDVYHVDLTFGY